jgi:hypothetical protein
MAASKAAGWRNGKLRVAGGEKGKRLLIFSLFPATTSNKDIRGFLFSSSLGECVDVAGRSNLFSK